MVFKMEITYQHLYEKLKETQQNDYDASILLFFSSPIIYDEVESSLSAIYFPLLVYFSTVAEDDLKKFKEVIDFLVTKGSSTEITSFDIDFILNRAELQQIFNKYSVGYLSEDDVLIRISKLFFTNDLAKQKEIFVRLHSQFQK